MPSDRKDTYLNTLEAAVFFLFVLYSLYGTCGINLLRLLISIGRQAAAAANTAVAASAVGCLFSNNWWLCANAFAAHFNFCFVLCKFNMQIIHFANASKCDATEWIFFWNARIS